MAFSLVLRKLVSSAINPNNSLPVIRPILAARASVSSTLFKDVFEPLSSTRSSSQVMSSMHVNLPLIGKENMEVSAQEIAITTTTTIPNLNPITWERIADEVKCMRHANRINLPKIVRSSDGIMGEMNHNQMFRPMLAGLAGIRVPVAGINLVANSHVMAYSLIARSWAHTTTKSGKPLKYNKYRKGRCSRRIKADGAQVSFGKYGIKSCEAGRISSRAIEAARRAIIGHFKRRGKLWIRVLADLPITKKPTEVRMGRGKGNVAGWVARVSMGQILFEMDGVSLSDAQQAATLATRKLSIATKFITWS